jgi:hypothetical protein
VATTWRSTGTVRGFGLGEAVPFTHGGRMALGVSLVRHPVSLDAVE